jgi:glycosyltransferase involved in cell wall biosynthesis
VSAATTVRRVVAPAGRVAMRAAVGVRTRGWAPGTRLFVVGDGSGWSLDEDARILEARARRLGIATAPSAWARFADRQAVFHTSHFTAVHPRWLETSNRVGTSWFHGRPGTPGYPEFDAAFDVLRRHADRFVRVQVTHAEMEELVLAHGVARERVFRIPIGIDLEHFPLREQGEREAARAALALPQAAFVVGSFQKDGVGWGEGLEPKLVKGPDVLVAALEALHGEVPELCVLLTGPARGYVKRELTDRRIPFRHVVAGSREELARAYRALDAYVVPSRQEGGPKAALEAMASGVPLVSTRVGQAQELVDDGVNGLLVDVEDAEALAGSVARVRDDRALVERMHAEGRETAKRHALELLDGQWAELLDGLVVRVGADGAR